MQRSASVAKEAGVDFEHLATWISLVSERTRLAPEVIGTAFQSILARLHQIRESGYSEDGGSTNQIINAFNTINQEIGTNLRLFEEDGVTWRKAQIVFEEIADSWNVMNDAQKAYITTALAGTRMQDRFLNLMDAMSDKTNGLSRYQELLGVAMESNGLTGKKYNVWLDSATAAQNDFIAATQELYNTVGAVDILKTFYYVLADIVESFGAS